MSYSIPSVSAFKKQFPRDFPYGVPAWGGAGSATLVAGTISAIAVTDGGFGYEKAPDVQVDDPTGSAAQVTATVVKGKITAFVVVDGGAGYTNPSLTITGGAGSNSDLSKVRDEDIEDAFKDAQFNVNPGLFGSQSDFQRAFGYLAAHMLVEKMLMAGEGLASQYNWLTTGKSVGDVSESFEIPETIAKDPLLSGFSKTRYGSMYLSIITPLLIGNMGTLFRQSMP